MQPERQFWDVEDETPIYEMVGWDLCGRGRGKRGKVVLCKFAWSNWRS